MEIFKQKPYLLTLLVVLASVKFIVMPILDWQNNKLVELRLSEKRLAKSEYAIANQDKIEPRLASLNEQVGATNSRLFPHQDENTFKLEQQKQLESLIARLGLKVNGIGWLNSTSSDDAIMRYQMQLNVGGDGVKIPQLFAAIEGGERWISIDDFTVAFRRQGKQYIGESNARITLNYYMLASAGE